MGLPTGYSLVSSVALAVLTLAGMQLFREELGVEGRRAVLGGFIGSWFFIFVLTAVGNLGTLMFGEGHYTKLFPEVIVCLIASMLVSGLVHRVSATTCLLFSLGALYFINKISSSVYSLAKQGPVVKSMPGKGKAHR